MILSFHPLIVLDENRLCAGRQPNAEDLAAIRSAEAVILPQGCYQALYEMARRNCRHVFPNYDARFNYPGKTGQAGLFAETGVAHPLTEIFVDVADYERAIPSSPRTYPLVFKFDWGGEGESVFFIDSEKTLALAISRAKIFEKTGQKGFVLQAYIPTGGKSLRVVVVGNRFVSYWRISSDPGAFLSGVSTGARIDPDEAPELQAAAKETVAAFCRKTRINLAGFDMLFRMDQAGRVDAGPLFLEINYFFGRRGLGGSEAYYRLFHDAVAEWLQSIPGKRKNGL